VLQKKSPENVQKASNNRFILVLCMTQQERLIVDRDTNQKTTDRSTLEILCYLDIHKEIRERDRNERKFEALSSGGKERMVEGGIFTMWAKPKEGK